MPCSSSLPIGLTLLAFVSLSFTVLSPRPGRVPGVQPVLSKDLLNGQVDVPQTKLGASPLFISRTSRCHHHPSPLRSRWWETQWPFLGYFTGTHRTGGLLGGLFRGSSPRPRGPSHLLPSWVPAQLWPARPSWEDCIQNSCEQLPSKRCPPCSLTYSAAEMRLKQQHQAPGLHRNHCLGLSVLPSPGHFNSQHGDSLGGWVRRGEEG